MITTLCWLVALTLNPSDVSSAQTATTGRIVREAHAVPPVGWRRTNRGWELFAEDDLYLMGGVREKKTWIVATTGLVRRVPPPLIALGMLAGVLLPVGCGMVFNKET